MTMHSILEAFMADVMREGIDLPLAILLPKRTFWQLVSEADPRDTPRAGGSLWLRCAAGPLRVDCEDQDASRARGENEP